MRVSKLLLGVDSEIQCGCVLRSILILVESYRRLSLLPLPASIQQLFNSIYLGNVAATIGRADKLREFEGGLLI